MVAFLLAVAGVVFVVIAFQLAWGPMRVGLLLLALTPAMVAVAALALNAFWLLPVAVPLLAMWLCYVLLSLAEYLRERAERQHAIQVFGRFVDPRVVEDLVKSGNRLLEERPRSSVITLLFSDIRGFTSLSENRPPEEIVAILNRYFSRQVEVIFRHHGTIDKFIGDAIMAFWGAPTADEQQAQNAVRAALEMARVVQAFREELGDSGRDFDIGIGIHTGPAVVGFIGSENKLDYTAIGDTVNLASRIEGTTKGVARILVSEATRIACGERFEFVEHGSFKVKGREQTVQLFEPTGERT
jgi:adenylate cyclase